MTLFDEVFLPIFFLGVLTAGTLFLLAGVKSGCAFPGFLLIGGTLALWAAMFFGSDMGYRAWQEMPGPPDEAFGDASILGALIFGWLPAGLFCLMVYAVVRGFRGMLHWAGPDAYPDNTPKMSQPTESGNPYQSPGN